MYIASTRLFGLVYKVELFGIRSQLFEYSNSIRFLKSNEYEYKWVMGGVVGGGGGKEGVTVFFPKGQVRDR